MRSFIVQSFHNLSETQKEWIQEAAKKSYAFTSEQLEGNLLFFNEINSGEFIFPFPCEIDRSTHVIARTNGECHLFKLSKAHVEKKLKEFPHLIDELHEIFHHWFASFSNALRLHRLDYPSENFKLTAKLYRYQKIKILISLHKVEDIYSVLWVKVIKGKFLIYGLPGLELSEKDHLLYPLPFELWLKSSETQKSTP